MHCLLLTGVCLGERGCGPLSAPNSVSVYQCPLPLLPVHTRPMVPWDYPLSTLDSRVTTAILGCFPLSLCAVVTLTAPPSSDVCRQWCGSAVGQWWVCHSTPRRGHTPPLSHDGGPAFGVGQATHPPETPAQRGSHLSFGARGNGLQIGIV